MNQFAPVSSNKIQLVLTNTHTSFLKVTPPVVMIFLHLVHLVANFSSKQPTQYTSVSLGIMKGLDPTWVLHTTHWKHLSCHFRVLYSIFFIPIFNKDKIVNWPLQMIRMILLGKFRLIRKSCSTWKSLILNHNMQSVVFFSSKEESNCKYLLGEQFG